MSYEITGKLLVKYDTQVVSDRFKKREFVLHKEENNNGSVFEDTIKFQLTQDRCDILNTFNVEDNIKVTFNVRGNKWEKDGTTSYFTNLDAWKVEALDSVQNHDSPVVNIEVDPSETGGPTDDLPF